MLYTVIPCRKGTHIKKVLDALKPQDTYTVVVRDRCSVECPGADAVLDSHHGDGFMAGYCRDIGIDYSIRHGADAVLLIDEDCIPQKDIVSAHHAAVSRKFPVISLGRRLESKLGWKDPRETGEAANWHVFSGKGSVVQNITWIKNCLATWTCNMCMNKPAVNVLRRAMSLFSPYKVVYEDGDNIISYDRLFDWKFDGHWGGEDAFLGYLAWGYRVTMAYLPIGANAVKHMDHPRPEPEYGKGFVEVLDAEVERLRKFMAVHPLSLDDMSY